VTKEIKKYSFSTKANTLKFLQQKIRKSKIEKILSFNVSDWQDDPTVILFNISKYFTKKIIVRSSAVGEDSLDSSEAGSYSSYLNVNPNSKSKIISAVNNVIKSYNLKNNQNKNNQILIQNQTQNIILSGVLFTRNPENGGPYYIINFEKGGSTTGVTQGLVNNSIKIFRNIGIHKIPQNWKKLLNSVHEIEKIIGSSNLDIEWGITNSLKIIIFQVRPLTSIKVSKNLVVDKKIEKLIKKSKIKFVNYSNSKTKLHKKQIFSDMTDWNPAEIIGNNVNPLDYSLYDFLIMKDSWHIGRKEIGYHNKNIKNLMIKFGNKPYVDVNKSFISLMPDNLPKMLRKKLLNYYLNKLSDNPQLHDKVEFELLFTAYDCSTGKRLLELKKYGFSSTEITLLSKSLKDLTNNIIQNFSIIEKSSNELIIEMSNNRKRILKNLNSNSNYKDLLNSAHLLLLDCKNLGTIPFSSMARISFIANSILKSLQKENHLDQKSVDTFMNSIHSVLYDFRKDLIDYSNNKLSKSNFLQKYGHLRPGTYDILTPRYDVHHSFLSDIKFSMLSKVQNNLNPKLISKILSNYGLNFLDVDFLNFVKQSLVDREKLKFEFTRNLSDALELISNAGKQIGFTRNEISYLDFNLIFLNYTKLSKKSLIKLWKHKIDLSFKEKEISKLFSLPAIISSEKDFEVIQYYNAKPNYITKNLITSDLVNIEKTSNNLLENKIILIENADPGFDWIFSKNPAGLITKYGGVASHMAIRCAELNLPAAIGCGDIIFNQLVNASKIILNCNEEVISILQNKIPNEFLEEQKVLKSLGYIK
jgi:phosphohistidine swiveling domain-containing protein